jgi:hypothetical protein
VAESKPLREKVEEALRKVAFFGQVKKIATRRKAAFADRVAAATADIEKQERWLRENPAAAPARTAWHRRALKKAHNRRDRYHEKLTFWRKRWVWARNRDEFWVELLEARQRKLRRRDRVNVSNFNKEMTGLHEHWTLTPAAKAVVAIGVLKFGLWVSSTFRPETPGSHHAEDPTRGADLAGEWDDMVRFQRWLYENHLPHILELYGPDNRLCADNGRPAPQAEGSFNENLHDSHDHAFIADPNYPLAYGGGR